MNQLISKIEKKLKQGDWYRIAFLGDSITSTEWVHPNWREIIEIVIKDKLTDVMGSWKIPEWKIRCYNAGFDGASTRELNSFIDEELALYQPDLVIFLDTYNDKYYDISPDDHRNNLDILFEKLIKLSEKVIFASSIIGLDEESNKQDREYMGKADEAMQKYKAKIQSIDLFSEYSKFDLNKFFTFISANGNPEAGIKPGEIDYSHPNQLGNAYIAKILLRDIFEIGFDADLYIKETLAGRKYPAY